jgi:hypothetical protein
MDFAERYAIPTEGHLGRSMRKTNDFKEVFYLRWGRIWFDMLWGDEANLKVVIKIYRSDEICELYVVDTDTEEVKWNYQRKYTRDFYIHPNPMKLGKINSVKFSYILHLREKSIQSQFDYIFMDGYRFEDERYQTRQITGKYATHNQYRTREADPGILQRDVDWHTNNQESLNVIPKFTRGVSQHPYHPKRYIHDRIDDVIRNKRAYPGRSYGIKVCVDDIDDPDFITHLIHASENNVDVQCIVDWRKMTLTNSESYVRLKRSGIELLGVVCTPKDPLIEVAPDMHNKFIIFGYEDCMIGSFNISFERWWANWESGFTFRSYGICRLLDNIFQSVRGGVIQKYGIDPMGSFNLLYTFGRHAMLNGKYYRPQHAIISEIHRARSSIKACLFVIGELEGENKDSVIDALIFAKNRGVDVKLIFNGHMARQGDPGQEYTMAKELARPLLPAIARLRRSGVPVALAYGLTDHPIPYSPLHHKFCVIDGRIVLDGSFNWYNTSIFSHDLLTVVSNPEVARQYLHEFHLILNSFRIFWA